MAGSRKAQKKDDNGILLKAGEDQLSNGNYRYRYTDMDGKRYSIYSPWLREVDRKRAKGEGESLREKEKAIAEDMGKGRSSADRRRISLNDEFEHFMDNKRGLKETTERCYRGLYDGHVRDSLGKRKISEIRYSDINAHYNKLMEEKSLSIGTVEHLNTVLSSVFALAVRDNLIDNNPTAGVMKEIKLSNHYERTERIALSIPEQTAFIDYVKNSRFDYLLPMFTVFLGTGMRVGELGALQWHDLNFKKRTIHIERTINYYKREGESCVFHMGTPKSKAGKRMIPMLPEVKSAFLKERQKQMMLGGCKANVDGYDDFVFTTANGKPYTRASIDYSIGCIIRGYNKQETAKAEKEHRKPVLLPDFSVHNLRHTFITRFCENETNLKVIQEIAGHSDISTTMNIYNKATAEAKQDSFKNLEGKMKIS